MLWKWSVLVSSAPHVLDYFPLLEHSRDPSGWRHHRDPLKESPSLETRWIRTNFPPRSWKQPGRVLNIPKDSSEHIGRMVGSKPPFCLCFGVLLGSQWFVIVSSPLFASALECRPLLTGTLHQRCDLCSVVDSYCAVPFRFRCSTGRANQALG